MLQKVREYEEEEEKVVLKMAELEAMLQQRGERLAVMRHLRHFCEEARRRIHSLDQGQKARFIRYLVDEIVLDSNRRGSKDSRPHTAEKRGSPILPTRDTLYDFFKPWTVSQQLA